MQIFDRKYRLFGVINLIDLLVIVAVIVAGLAVYRVLRKDKGTDSTATGRDITYTIVCPTLRGIGPEQIKVGDTVYKVTGKPIGTVKSVRAVPTASEVWDQATSSIKRYDSSVISDIYVEVSVKGAPTSSGVAVGDLLLHGNQPMPFMTSTFECDTASIGTMTIAGQ